ncbi:MAG: cyclic nucleotide-binding domain-containing protein [Leptospiraceae bacterium]|nr:cyclic nucleotide-binding domain-containing protein [Leptospiraceae bacterium]MCP5512887.1 cyclic nucleotide-binding domain-containing protein [Leptospiraceae bacterium]
MTDTSIKEIINHDLLENSNTHEYKQGDVIISEGDASNETMYFIVHGTLSVYKERNKVLEEINQLSAGEFFGEIALVSDQQRTASILVKSDSAKLILFSKSKFVKQTRSNPALMFTILRAAVARVFKAETSFEQLLKAFYNFRPEIISKLNQNKVRATNIKVLDFLQNIHSDVYTKGTIFQREAAQATGQMYFLVRGEVRAIKSINQKNYYLTEYDAGDYFGEISFFSGKPQFASYVVHSEQAEIVAIDRKTFMEIVEIFPEFIFQELKSFIWKLINTEKANSFLKSEIEASRKDTDIRDYKKGEIIIAENDPSNETMYFILNGEFFVLKDRGETRDVVNIISKGDFFGELSLISNQPRSATVMVKSDTASLILFSKKKFIEQTRQNPSLMMSILKATIARLLRAEKSLDKVIKKLPNLDPNLQINLNSSRSENINIFKYVHSVYSSILTKGEKVYSEGDASNGSMFFLLKGSLSVYKRLNSKRLYKVTTLEAGDFFGEMSVVSSLPRFHTIIAASDKAKIASIDKSILQKIINLNPGFLLSLLRTVIWKLIIMEKAVTKYNIEYDMYESNL